MLNLCHAICNHMEMYTDEIIFNFEKVPYFFAYMTECFSFQNNPKNLDPS